MTKEPLEEDVGFHAGELAVQRRAGVAAEAARLEGMVGPGHLDGGVGRFLQMAGFGVLSGRDRGGRLWVSPLLGDRGFLRVLDYQTLEIARDRIPGDPLAELEVGSAVGVNVIEFSRRARVRVNGTLLRGGAVPVLGVGQAYGNCPQYITPRHLSFGASADGEAAGDAGAAASGARSAGASVEPETRTQLSDEDIALIESADTFFLGTSHPARGNDASHRGGPAGFVTVSGDEISWPDFPGNNMFNSLGNLEVNPEAALLFVDFDGARALAVSGRAVVDWADGADELGRSAGRPGTPGPTGRRVRFTVEAAAATVLRRARDHPA